MGVLVAIEEREDKLVLIVQVTSFTTHGQTRQLKEAERREYLLGPRLATCQEEDANGDTLVHYQFERCRFTVNIGVVW
jgi:hypothetical protein